MKYVGVDIETQPPVDGGEYQFWCIGVADGESRRSFTNLAEGLAYIGDRTPVIHNAGYDLSYIDPNAQLFGTEFRDTLTEAHLLGYYPKNLPDLTAVFLTGEPLDKTAIKDKKVRYEDRPQQVLETCSKDAWATWALREKWAKQTAPYEGLLEKERKITRILMDMKRAGMPVSQRKLKLARKTILKNMAEAEDTLEGLGIPPTERADFAEWFWKGKNQLKTTTTGKLSTKGEELREFATEEQLPYVEAFLTWHQLDKYKTTYIEAWVGKDFVHGNLNQTGTATWRYSSSDPNLQNVPKKGSKIVPLYQLFEAPEGWVFISFDYSQAELRRLAVETQDPRLLEVYRNNGDLHQETVDGLVARGVFRSMSKEIQESDDHQRRFAKTLNFGIPYGMGGRTYANRTGLRKTVSHDRWGRPVRPRIEPDERAGQQFVDAWYAKYAAVRPWQERQIAFAEEHGYVETMEGRPLWVPGIYAEYSQIRHHAEKQCGNYPIQGGVAEVVKDAMIRCPDYLVQQVHDELLYLVPESIANEYFAYLAEALVDNRHEIPYLVDGHMGRSWGALKDIEDIWVDDDE